MALSDSYYDQEKLFTGLPEPYQVQTRADVLSMVPRDARSILDVGCGDGFITNNLPDDIRVVGLDISPTALKRVTRETVLGSVSDLPFPDNSFDLVMANDVLEHLDAATHAAAVSELSRVAARYILLTTPYAEQLEVSQTKCTRCKTIYHINRHLRSFNEERLAGLFYLPFAPVEMRFSGAITHQAHDPYASLRNDVGLFTQWPLARCPTCGSGDQDGWINPALRRGIETERSTWWAEQLAKGYRHNNRSEIICLYAVDPSCPLGTLSATNTTTDSLLVARFSNPLQVATPDFTPGVFWTKFDALPGVEQTDQGLRLADGVNEPVVVSVYFPVVTHKGDRLLLGVSGNPGTEALKISTTIGLAEDRGLLLATAVVGSNTSISAMIDHPWHPNRFGTGVEIQLVPGVTLHSCRYDSPSIGPCEGPFGLLQSGHNVLLLKGGQPRQTWGLLCEAGAMPIPTPSQGATATEETFDPFVARAKLCATMNRATGAVRQQNELAADDAATRDVHDWEEGTIEAACQVAERACGVIEDSSSGLDRIAAMPPDRIGMIVTQSRQRQTLRAQIRTLRAQIRRLARSALHAQSHQTFPPFYAEPWTSFDPADAPALPGPKVLIISHMFPCPEQWNLGCFVHEQAKALRTYAGIDARVLVGRPFWMSHIRNPFQLLETNRWYHECHSRSQWQQLNGVPVRYVPYRILKGSWWHGWMYRKSIVAALDEVRASFPFDLIHAHTSYLDGSAGRLVSQRFGAPLLITEHTGPFSALTNKWYKRRQVTKSLQCAAKALAVSRKQRDSILPHVPDEEAGKVIVVHNGVDTDLFYPPPQRLPDPRAPRLVYVGYFDPIKNLPILMEAFAAVRKEVPHATLSFVGEALDEEYEAHLRGLVQSLDLAESVSFLGAQPRANVATILRYSADMLILPSKAETFGCVLIEALASGMPVVATRCGGPEDIVTSEELGELCEPNSTEALTQTILRVIRKLPSYDPAVIHADACERFSYRSIARELVDIYADVLGG